MGNEIKGEILSPVGNFDMLYAAVRSGANAVYFGAKDFSARRNAENFSLVELKNAIDYCHIRGVRAYLTLNIIIKNEEMVDAVSLAQTAYNYGIDGIIVQDLGLARVLHSKIPNLPLHASTQMSIHTPSALPLLKKMGFCQVVAAREMSKNELIDFCKAAKELGIVVEVFVHGALCMSMSGQCLLSAYLGSRSGNRGLCAGPCRLPFEVQNGTGYDLSLKDLSLLEYISELSDMGVGSFKIEGRMKRPEYVAAATKACSQALNNGFVDIKLQETLQNVFSRSGFTSGYIEDKLGREMFGIRTKEDVISADKAFPLLHEIYRNELQSVPITVKLEARQNENISITLCDGANTITVSGGVPDIAKTQSADEQSVLKNLDKFGTTPYYPQSFEILIDDGLFIRAGEINNLRRTACEQLSLKRCAINRGISDFVFFDDTVDTIYNSKCELYIRVENKEQIPRDLSEVSAVILPLENDFDYIDGVTNIVEIPRGILSESVVKNRLVKYKNKGVEKAICGNLSAVKIATDLGFQIIADTGLNVYNNQSALAISRLGCESVVLSNEMLLSDAVKLKSPIPKGIVSYGNIPLMLFKNCPLKNGRGCNSCNHKDFITDRKGITFPIRCRMGYSELLNSLPVYLADKQSLYSSLDFQILYFTIESSDDVEKIIDNYKNQKQPDFKYTRGLFFRGTI